MMGIWIGKPAGGRAHSGGQSLTQVSEYPWVIARHGLLLLTVLQESRVCIQDACLTAAARLARLFHDDRRVVCWITGVKPAWEGSQSMKGVVLVVAETSSWNFVR